MITSVPSGFMIFLKIMLLCFDNLADTVRGLGVMPGLGILSSSHDGLVFIFILFVTILCRGCSLII